jgi:hypothetical protein
MLNHGLQGEGAGDALNSFRVQEPKPVAPVPAPAVPSAPKEKVYLCYAQFTSNCLIESVFLTARNVIYSIVNR